MVMAVTEPESQNSGLSRVSTRFDMRYLPLFFVFVIDASSRLTNTDYFGPSIIVLHHGWLSVP